MPIHDWTKVDAGIFHAFHLEWIAALSRSLNRGLLPPSYYALPEQIAGQFGPDVLTLRRPHEVPEPADEGGLALATAPPKVRLRVRSDAPQYVDKSVAIRHVSDHQIVALIEVVSPGNKSGRRAIDAFVSKAREMLRSGIHLLVADLFPPTPRDPDGLHCAIWDDDKPFSLPPDKRLTFASYLAAQAPEAFVEFFGVGDELTDMPLFLTPDRYVNVPLEQTYLAAWDAMPRYWQDVLEGKRA